VSVTGSISCFVGRSSIRTRLLVPAGQLKVRHVELRSKPLSLQHRALIVMTFYKSGWWQPGSMTSRPSYASCVG